MYDLRNAFTRVDLDDNMHMVLLDTDFMDPPSVQFASFIQKSLQADRYFAPQNAFSVLGNPYQMVLQSVLGMSAGPVFAGHDQIMPEIPPLRHRKRGVAPGGHSSPSLKARGFLADVVKKYVEDSE